MTEPAVERFRIIVSAVFVARSVVEKQLREVDRV